MRVEQFDKMMNKQGWVFVRANDSHRVYLHTSGQCLIVALKHGKVHDKQMTLVRQDLRRFAKQHQEASVEHKQAELVRQYVRRSGHRQWSG